MAVVVRALVHSQCDANNIPPHNVSLPSPSSASIIMMIIYVIIHSHQHDNHRRHDRLHDHEYHRMLPTHLCSTSSLPSGVVSSHSRAAAIMRKHTVSARDTVLTAVEVVLAWEGVRT